jgi:hypothetical protein
MKKQMIWTFGLFLVVVCSGSWAHAAQKAVPLLMAEYADLNNNFTISVDTRGKVTLIDTLAAESTQEGTPSKVSQIGKLAPALVKKIQSKVAQIQKRDLKQKDPGAQPGMGCPSVSMKVFKQVAGSSFGIYSSTACVEQSLPEAGIEEADDSIAIRAVQEFLQGLISAQAES